MGNVQLCHLSFHFNLFAIDCNVRIKYTRVIVIFYRPLLPPQVTL